MLELKEKPKCCGKEMKHNLNTQNMLKPNANTQSWICLVCGRFITLVDDQLDEEELENYKNNEIELLKE